MTNPLRTVCDLGSLADATESTVAVDMALHANLTTLQVLSTYVDMNGGAKGVKRLRKCLALADARSESPMETRLRLQLINARLPRPCVQVDLHDHAGRFLGRADLYYSDVQLVIEFDGQNHKDRLVPDLRRQNALVEAGYHVLRFTAPDIRTPGLVASRVRAMRKSLRRPLG